jgi:hypothetical protein
MSEPVPPPPPSDGQKPLWKRWWVWVAAAVVLIIIASLAGGDEPDEQAAPVATATSTPFVPATTPPTTAPTTPPATQPEPDFPKAPKPKVFKGSGSKVIRDVRFETDAPLVVTGTHSGFANFIVELVPRGGGEFDSTLLFNEIGKYDGQVAVGEFTTGQFRVSVDADGSWTLKFEQPEPSGDEKKIPGTIKGEGAKVVQIVSEEDLQPIVIGKHTGGESNFIVEVIGYSDLSGSILLFNEIGRFDGETIADEMPAGNYLLAVVADGSWTIKFER